MTTTKVGMASARTAYAGETALAHTLAALGGAATDGGVMPVIPSGGDRFELGALLGEGGMGRVHVARDLQFGRDVALKELSDHVASPEGARRFAIEAMVTGNLEHPGIPAVYERGVRQGKAFYAMRRVDGRPMSAVIAEAKTLPARLALLPAVTQVAHTLGFAHSRGVVHRDIKPDNVLIAAHGEVVVVDWGIAKVEGASDVGSALSGPGGSGDAGSRSTLHGSVLGTPAYMAPEQARGEVDAIDARTDVFAVGAMLYQVLSGHAPYEGPTTASTLAAALEGRREPLGDDIPTGLRAIVDKAMAHKQADRFANADEIASAIGAFMTEAVTHKPSLVARVVVGVATAALVLVSTFAAAFALSSISGLSMQGGPGYVYTALAVVGLVLLATEWGTRGRHGLLPLVRATALATVLTGLGGTFAGYGMVAGASSGMVEDGRDPTAIILEGVWEASGNVAGAAQLSALLFVLAAVVARRPKAEGAR